MNKSLINLIWIKWSK